MKMFIVFNILILMNSKGSQCSLSLFLAFMGFISLCSAQNICYVNCAYGQCSQTNILSCTSCEQGFLLINGQCIPTGGQSQPIQRRYTAVSQNLLQVPASEESNVVTCNINYPIASPTNITYANLTISAAKYRISPIPITVPGQHEYVQIKINAILFNDRSDPQIFILVVNSRDQNQISKVIEANTTSSPITCNGSGTSFPFYISEKFSSTDGFFSLEIQTRAEGDELGVANLQVYAGNCHPSCASCFGSTNFECFSCRGLFRYNNSTRSCETCPFNFYIEGGLCLPCPPSCIGCTKEEGVIKCDACDDSLQSGLQLPFCELTIQTISSLTELSFNDRDGWVSDEVGTDVFSACGSFSLVGGTPKGRGLSVISQTFTNLKIHSAIWIKFIVFLIDQKPQSNYRMQISVDEYTFTRQIPINPNNQSNSECGTSDIEYVAIISENDIQHSADSVSVSISGISNFFGIRDFTLGVINTTSTENCFSVLPSDQSVCAQCNFGFELADNSTCNFCPQGFYELNNTCEICPIFCRTCQYNLGVDKPYCTSCDKPLNQNQEKNECSDDESLMYTIEIFPNVNEIVNNQWTFYPKLQTRGFDKCGEETILGSTTIKYRSLVMTRQFSNLPNHRGVTFQFHFYQIDDYDDFQDPSQNLHGIYFVAGGQKFPYNVSNNKKQICGNSTLDSVQKIILSIPTHNQSTITLEVHANRTKLGLNNLLVFLESCSDCQNSVGYEMQTIPVYSIDTPPLKGIKTKLIFQQPIQSTVNISSLINFQLINGSEALQQGTGLFTELQLLEASLINNRQLIQLRSLSKNHVNETLKTIIENPGSIFAEGSNINKPLSSKSIEIPFPRYDEVSEGDKDPRSNMRNLQNLFRGVAVLSMFVGLISFFFVVSSAFDDLFLLCQLIFVHIFIQSAYNPITFKIPVSGMQLSQFILWLPIQARTALENGIIPQNHYQRSPIIYEQYFEDVTFARTIYHTVIFLVIMLIFYGIIWVCITGFSAKKEKDKGYIAKYYNRQRLKKFSYLNKIVRFVYFTVVWASALQFTSFTNQPQGFHIWNSILLVVLFILAIIYPIISFLHIRNKSNSIMKQTFENLYFQLRIQGGKKFFYFLFFYYKLLAIALLIGLLYNTNPVAILLPLVALNIFDGVILIVVKPYYLEYPEERIGSFFTKRYLRYYWISHIIQTFLLAVLEIFMLVVYGQRIQASYDTYLALGYICCVIVALLLFNGLVRLTWNLIYIFEGCYDDIKSEDVKVESVEENTPLKEPGQAPLSSNIRMLPSQGRRVSIANNLIS